ncbi:MAG TPA: hypothetical protein VMZ28_14975 [Kofleriaceae bacterium]|nr:hypothetical protein [Kofleriaceae bacterium]
MRIGGRAALCVAVVTSACRERAAEDAPSPEPPKETAPAPRAPPAPPAPIDLAALPSFKVSEGTSTTLPGGITIELEGTGGGSGPGIAASQAVMRFKRGAETTSVSLMARMGGGFPSQDMDAEVVVFGQAFVIIDGDSALEVVPLPGPPPEPITPEETEALLAAAARSSGRPLGLRRTGARRLGLDPAGGGAYAQNDGMTAHVITDGHRPIWIARVGDYSRRVWILDAPPTTVMPPELPGGVPISFGESGELPGGVRAALMSVGSAATPTLVLQKGGERTSFRLATVDLAPTDAEVIAFGRLFLVQQNPGTLNTVSAPRGPVPQRIDAAAARALVEKAAADAGWPAATLAEAPAGSPGILELHATVGDGLAWIGRVGVYTRRVWVDPPP